MPHKDPDARREYFKKIRERHRDAWFADHGQCEECGTSDALEIDFSAVPPELVIRGDLWKAAKVRREAVLAHCRVLCRACRCFKEVCPSGHAMTEDNVYLNTFFYRTCLTCKRAGGRDYLARQREKRDVAQR